MTDDRRTLQERLAGTQLDSLEEKIRNCTNASELQDLMTASREMRGSYVRRQDGFMEFNPSETMSAPPAAAPPIDPTVAKAVEGLHLLREVFRMPNGDLREISAYSYSGLDLLHASIEREGGKKIGGNA
jgi:hypothetical protein